MASRTGASSPKLTVKRLRDGAPPLPAYQSAGAAGLDLCAALDQPLSIAPGARALVGTGYALAVPAGYEGQVRPRSGLAWKHGVTVLNAPGTIDSDYRGEIQVVLVNHGDRHFVVKPGMRIAQLAICPVARVSLRLVDELDATGRGAGGYGSTGV
ncbi:MAG: dUTP diphosphatase [Deltaproteobacteria bacterium]|nr:dUTP diphosphatase [Deltaproteobacteria bacterium]